MNEPYVMAYTTRYDESSDERLDTYEESFDCTPDEIDLQDGLTPVDLALNAMKYVSEYSGTEWYPHGWYAEETYIHPYDSTREGKTFHLHGFTEEQSRAIYKRFNPRGPHFE